MKDKYKSLLISEETHERLKEYCRAKGLKMGNFAESSLVEKLEAVGAKDKTQK